MTSASKAKGSKAELDVVNWLKQWFPYADRRLAGATLDKGDISGIPGVTIEIKNHAKMDLAGWVAELETEMNNNKYIQTSMSAPTHIWVTIYMC